MNMKILISAGPTREYIDPVRFISNPSTGKMGYLIAQYSLKAGFEVDLVTGPTFLSPPAGARTFKVETAMEMRDAVLERFACSDVLVMSAAVGDWKPAAAVKSKLKRKEKWSLNLVPNPDILKEAGLIKTERQRIIGFALETENLIRNASKKLKEKNLDLIVADTPEFFGEGRKSKVVFLHRDGKIKEFEGITKEEVAEKIVGLIKEYSL